MITKNSKIVVLLTFIVWRMKCLQGRLHRPEHHHQSYYGDNKLKETRILSPHISLKNFTEHQKIASFQNWDEVEEKSLNGGEVKNQTQYIDSNAHETLNENPDSVSLPTLVTALSIEIDFVPGIMNVSQRELFEKKLEIFLHEKINLSSSHSVSIVGVDLTNENIIEADDGMFVLQEDGLFVLIADIVVKGLELGGEIEQNTNRNSSDLRMSLERFSELSQEAIAKHEEFLARDVHLLADEDDFFQHVYEVRISTVEKEYVAKEEVSVLEQAFVPANPLSYDPKRYTPADLHTSDMSKIKVVVGIIAVTCAAVLGLIGITLFLVHHFRNKFTTTSSISPFSSSTRKWKYKLNLQDEVTTITTLPTGSSTSTVQGPLDDFTEIDEDSFHGSEARRAFKSFTYGNSPLLSSVLKKSGVHSPSGSHKSNYSLTKLDDNNNEEVEIRFNNNDDSQTLQTRKTEPLFQGADETRRTSLSSITTINTSSTTAAKVCYAPPGKLGVAIDSIGGISVVHKVKKGSPLEGILMHLDRIVGIDDVSTVHMSAAEVTKLMVSKMNKSRKIYYTRQEEDSLLT